MNCDDEVVADMQIYWRVLYEFLPVKLWNFYKMAYWSVVLLVLAEDSGKRCNITEVTTMAVRCISALME